MAIVIDQSAFAQSKNEGMAGFFPTLDNTDPADVTVVVISYNTKHLLTRMLTALDVDRGQLRLQVIVVDNASRDGSAEILRNEFPNIELIQNAANVGFGRANNQALSSVRGRYVLLVNPDAFVSSDTLSKTFKFMEEHSRCGGLGVKLVGEDGGLKPCCCYFPTPWNVALKMTRLDRFFPGTRLVHDMSPRASAPNRTGCPSALSSRLDACRALEAHLFISRDHRLEQMHVGIFQLFAY